MNCHFINEMQNRGFEGFWASKNAVILVVSVALFTDMLVYDVLLPLLPELLLRANSSTSNSGLLIASYAFGLLVITPFLGFWSDKHKNRKLPMVIGQIGLIFSTLIFIKARNIYLLVIARILQGFAASATWTVGLALVADVVEPDELGASFGVIFGFNTFGYLLGPILGGILSEYSSIDIPFYICAILAFLDLVSRFLLKPQVLCNRDNGNRKLGIVKILKNSRIGLISSYIIVYSLITASIEASLVRHLYEKFRFSPFYISIFLLSWIISSIIFGIIGGRLADKYDRYSLLKKSLISSAICIFFMGLIVNNRVLLFIFCFLFGMTTSLLYSPTLPEMGNIVNLIGQKTYGVAYGITNICSAIGMFLGPLLSDLISRHANNELFIISSYLALLCVHLLIIDLIWNRIKSK
jgi:MFS transporter, DHA1 family, solute carrier family 18 (vesicular amine transporter), member 1/2